MIWIEYLWKIYFWFYFLILFPFEYIHLFEHFPYGVIDLIVSIPSIIGLFLYVFKIRLFTPKYWQAYFVIYISWNIIYSLIAPEQQIGNCPVWVEMSLGVLLGLPMYIGLCLYAFKSFKTEENIIEKRPFKFLKEALFFLIILISINLKKGPPYFILLALLATLYFITAKAGAKTHEIKKIGYDQIMRLRARSMGTLACVLIMIIMLILPAMSIFLLFLNAPLKVHLTGVVGLLIGVPVLVMSISQVQYSLKEDLEFRIIYLKSLIFGALLLAILSIGEFAFVKAGGVKIIAFLRENIFISRTLNYYDLGNDKVIFRDNVTSRFRSSSDFEGFQKTMADTRQLLGEVLSKKEVFEFRERYKGTKAVFYRMAFDVHHKKGNARHYFSLMLDGNKLSVDGWAVLKDGHFLFAQGNLYDMPLGPKGKETLISYIPKTVLKDVRTDYLDERSDLYKIVTGYR